MEKEQINTDKNTDKMKKEFNVEKAIVNEVKENIDKLLKKKEFNLSEKEKYYGYYEGEDVKEFIKMLKEEIRKSNEAFSWDSMKPIILKKIDKLAGDKLI